jgi:hypothetical protein
VPIPLEVDSDARTFRLRGSFENEDGSVEVDLTGSIVNQPPRVRTAGPQEVQCTGAGGSPITLDASASTDPDGDDLLFQWFDGPALVDVDNLVGDEARIDTFAPLGSTRFQVAVGDESLVTAIGHTDVSVVDTVAPTLDVELEPTRLWPPNHRFWVVEASVGVEDLCDPEAIFLLVSITSNEPEDGRGDGNTEPDVEDADFGTSDTSFALRAERVGGGAGRTYTVVYQALDSSGNVAEASARVQVPPDQSR